MELVVCDNSDAGRERGNIEALASQGLRVTYVHEPAAGIPLARNAALDAALRLNADWIAFVDDDEVAPQSWLARLFEVAKSTAADVVHGTMVPTHAKEIAHLAASWRAGNSVPTARRTRKAATNNVLFRTWIVAAPALLRFDENMRACGGSDGEFFMRAADAGAVMVRTGDAPIFEEQGEERKTASWQRRRAFRVGANCNYRYRKNRKPSYLAAVLVLGRAAEGSVRGLAKALSSLLLLPVNVARAATLAKNGTVDLCFAWGCVAPYFGVRPTSYH